MRQHEILLAAIKKAESNGFIMDNHKHFCEIGRDFGGEVVSLGAYESIIFDHEFAKAFFGDLPFCDHCLENNCAQQYVPVARWCYEIKELAIADDRIEYLESFIK